MYYSFGGVQLKTTARAVLMLFAFPSRNLAWFFIIVCPSRVQFVSRNRRLQFSTSPHSRCFTLPVVFARHNQNRPVGTRLVRVVEDVLLTGGLGTVWDQRNDLSDYIADHYGECLNAVGCVCLAVGLV